MRPRGLARPPGAADDRRIAGSDAALAVHRLVNATAAEYPDDVAVPTLFERCVDDRPTAVAVTQDSRSLTYLELDDLANGLAHRLLADGVQPDTVVGVCLARSPELIVALLAVLKCGAAYLPFDVAWPDERLRQLFADAGCTHAVTDRPAVVADRFSELRVVSGEQDASTASNVRPATAISPDAIAYVNFTSGSTGQPKGVPIRHRSIARLVFAAVFAPLDANSRSLFLAPITFDAATVEIWGALLRGGTCVLYPDRRIQLSELGDTLRAERVTVLWLATALFNTIVDEDPTTIATVGTILTGGEAHSVDHMTRALAIYGPGRIVNGYGPTESTTFAAYFPVDEPPLADRNLPIGRPIQNTRIYLVAGNTLCAPGETGEIVIAGDGLATGYLGMPALTAERFVDWEIDGVHERVYRTGDYGFFTADGDIVFEGRRDDQFKVNGYRIELGEIAHHLDRHPAVRQSYATVTTHGDKAVVAFAVTDGSVATGKVLRRYLEDHLPAFMVPRRVHLCERFPLTPSCKVDRRQLLERFEGPRRPVAGTRNGAPVHDGALTNAN